MRREPGWGTAPAAKLADGVGEALARNIRRGKQTVPAIIVYYPQGSTVIPVPWLLENERAKQVGSAALRETMRQFGVFRYVMFSEAWTSFRAKKADGSFPEDLWTPEVMPRDDPNRGEMLWVAVCDKDKEPVFRAWEIKRGDKITLTKGPGDFGAVGRFLNLLEDVQ